MMIGMSNSAKCRRRYNALCAMIKMYKVHPIDGMLSAIVGYPAQRAAKVRLMFPQYRTENDGNSLSVYDGADLVVQRIKYKNRIVFSDAYCIKDHDKKVLTLILK